MVVQEPRKAIAAASKLKRPRQGCLRRASVCLCVLLVVSVGFTASVLLSVVARDDGSSNAFRASLRHRTVTGDAWNADGAVFVAGAHDHTHADLDDGGDMLFDPLTDKVRPPRYRNEDVTSGAATPSHVDADGEALRITLTYSDIDAALRSRAARSAAFPSGRTRPASDTKGSVAAGDDVLMLGGENFDSVATTGLAYRRPTAGSYAALVGGSAVAESRRASETSADLAIVVVSAPRWLPLQRDPAQPHYFRHGTLCSGAAVLAVHPCAVGVAPSQCVATLAAACDSDPLCVGFVPADGRLIASADATFACPVPRSSHRVGRVPNEGVGTYLKSPLAFAASPRQVRISRSGYVNEPSVGSREVWYFAPHTTVAGGTNSPNFVGKASAATLASAAATCVSTPHCASFTWPEGVMFNTTHPGLLTTTISGPRGASNNAMHAKHLDEGLYSVFPLAPLDYVVQTVVSLADELGEDCSAGGAFNGRAHLYVADASPPAMHVLPGTQDDGAASGSFDVTRRGPATDDYWLPAFAWLRRTYGARPCITFLPATAYTRITETSPPPHGRGEPGWHVDHRGKSMRRANVVQTLDFVSAIRHAVAASPAAHLLVWEDDCFACAGTLATLSRAVDTVAAFDPPWGGFKVGNGGSGMLFHADIAATLVTYLISRRGSDGVDVSMWRFLHSGGYPDYLARVTLSAHRGLHSSFAGGGPAWKRVECGNALDWYWGEYTDCVIPGVPEGQRSTGVVSLASFASEWRCSVWSAASAHRHAST